MNYGRTKKALVILLASYAFIGFGAHATSTGAEDAYPFFSWFLYVTVPSRVQTGFDSMLVSVNGKRLETPLPLLDRPDIFSKGELTEQRLSALIEELAYAIRARQSGHTSALREKLETHFNTQASYIVREYTYDPLEYFKNKRIASSTVLMEFQVGK